MLEKETIERAKDDKREGKAASTQAGEFVREEIEHVREGKHGVNQKLMILLLALHLFSPHDFDRTRSMAHYR